MNSSTRRNLIMAALVAPVAFAAKAQSNWPSRPIDYVVPYPPGGTTDILGRSIAQGMAAEFRQSVIVENKPGATGTIGGAFVARARPDGYTILGTSIGPQTIVPHLMKGLPYGPLSAYAPVVLVGTMPHVLVVAPKSAFHSVQELVAAARQKPGRVSFASGGTGTILQIQGELLCLQTGTHMLHVPYSGDVPAMQSVMAGQVNFAFLPLPAALPQVQSGKLRALAVTAAGRLNALPQVATMTQLGFRDFVVEQWQAVYAPAHTPESIVLRLNQAINQTIAQPSVVTRFEKLGVTIAGGPPEILVKRQSADYERWGRVIKAAHITME